MTAPPGRRTLHVEHCMGTVFTIDVRGEGDWTDAISAAVRWLHRVDELFSTYRPDSEIARLNRRELAMRDAHRDVRAVLDLCTVLHDETRGHFSALLDGRIDPTGVVKGWAIERASALLRERGSHHHAVNGGGDVQLAGAPAPHQPWRIGISDPHDRARVLAVVEGRDLAIATSGVAERGPHIIDPFRGAPATALAAVTVVGSGLARVDAYATAAFTMGERAVDWLDARPGYEGLVVRPDGTARTTRGWPAVRGVGRLVRSRAG